MSERLDHELYNLLPKHRILQQHVMVNDALPNRILSGTVVMKSNIDRFTPNGVIFEGEKNETKCDAVIFATGYHFKFEFFDKEDEALRVDHNNQMDLYKFVFPAKLKHAHTLAFIGLIQPLGSIFPIAEMQARWFVELFNKRCEPLPPNDVMLRRVKEQRAYLKWRYHESARHSVQVDYVTYMNELAEQFGVVPNLWHYFFNDFNLWREMYFGPMVPYQFRLEGPGKWHGARQGKFIIRERLHFNCYVIDRVSAILETTKRIEAPLQTRAGAVRKPKDGKLLSAFIIWFIIAGYVAARLGFW